MAATRTPSPAELARREKAATDRLRQTTTTLHAAVDRLTTRQQWSDLLAFAGPIRDLSFHNTALVWAQHPDATSVADYDTWIERGRQVRSGEKAAARILAAVPDKQDPAAAPGARHIIGLATQTVFDLAQTDPLDPDDPNRQTAREPQPGFARGDEKAAAAALRQFADARHITLPPDAAATELAAAVVAGLLPSGLDDRVAAEATASATHALTQRYGLPAAPGGLDFVDQWGQMPTEQRRAHMAEVGNRALLAARTIMHTLDTGAPSTTPHQDASRAARAAVATATPVATTAAAAAADEVSPSVDLNTIAAVNTDALRYFLAYGRRELAAEYLIGRGITAPAWQPVGYAPVGGGLVDHLRTLGYSDAAQLAAGVARTTETGKLVDVFRDRIIAPIHDDVDRLAGFTGRSLRDREPRYLNTRGTALFAKSRLLYGLDPASRAALRAGATPVLVEGVMDALAIAQYGPEHLVPVAACGTALTEHHAAVLEDLAPQRRIIIALDDDAAGVTAAVRAGEMLAGRGWTARCPKPTGGLDPADLAAKRGRGILSWLEPKACRPVIYLAVEQHAPWQPDRTPDTHARRAAAADQAIAYLTGTWPAGQERDNAIRYAATRLGQPRPLSAPAAGGSPPVPYATRMRRASRPAAEQSR